MSKYTPKTRDDLSELANDPDILLSDIDTSHIKDMSQLFNCERTDFSGIENWDVSKVKDMSGMFA